MAIIYSYPTATPVGSDTMIGTQQAVDESGDNLTVTFTVASIANFTKESIFPTPGTVGYLPVFSGGRALADSPIFVDSFGSPTVTTVGTNLTIAGGSSISNDLTVGGQTLTDTLEVTTSAEIQGELSMGGAINMGGLLINNVSDPVDAQDAATKAYVDANTEEVEFAITLRQPARFQVSVQPGDPVYITGYNVGQGRYEVDLAQAGDPARMPAIGVAADTYGTNDNGYIITHGAAEGINTNAFDVGDTVWVGQFGGLTNIRPSGINLVQNVGVVGKKSAGAGEIEAIALGRTNDVPNIPRGSMWVGDATGVANPLPIGTAGQILVSDGTDVNWQDDDTDVSLTQGSLWIGDAANKKSELAIGSLGQVLVSDGTTAVWQDDDTDVTLTLNKIWVGNSANKQEEAFDITFDQGNSNYIFGTNNTIANSNVFVVGSQNIANATYASARGRFNQSSGVYSFTVGQNNAATGDYSIAMGFGNTVNNTQSLAIGGTSVASGANSVALGQSATASGNNALAFGFGATAANVGSVALGYQASASGNYSAAFGREADARNYNFSTALGYQATNTSEQQTALGQKLLFNEYGSGLNTGTSAYYLTLDASGNVIEEPFTVGPVDGVGTDPGAGNFKALAVWEGPKTLGDSPIKVIQSTIAGPTYADNLLIGDWNATLAETSNRTLQVGNSNTVGSTFGRTARAIIVGESNQLTATTTQTQILNSTVIGKSNIVSASETLVVGKTNTVRGGNGFVVGVDNTTSEKVLRQFVIGRANTVDSVDTIVLGDRNTVTETGNGFGSMMVFGHLNTVLGDRVLCLGTSNTANSDNQDAYLIGVANSSTADRTYTLGRQNSITANESFALGQTNTITGTQCVAVGVNNTLAGFDKSYAFGFGNDNVNYKSFAIGDNNDVLNKQRTYLIGRENQPQTDNTFILGQFSDPTVLRSNNTQGRSTIAFAVGSNNTTRRTAWEFRGKQTSAGATGAGDSMQIMAWALWYSTSYADDTAAAAGGVEVGQLYRTGSTVKIRMT